MANTAKIMNKMRDELKRFEREVAREVEALTSDMRKRLKSSKGADAAEIAVKSIESVAARLGKTAGKYLHRISDQVAAKGVQVGSLTTLFHSAFKSGGEKARAKFDAKNAKKIKTSAKKAAKKAAKTGPKKLKKVKSSKAK